MVHGNGGASTRFALFQDLLEERGPASLQLRLPELPGFDGRPLPPQAKISWEPFLAPLRALLHSELDEPWIFYGHGIGGSLLLEWAAREWSLSNGSAARPSRVILHGSIGASLEHRLFPQLMRPAPVRALAQWLIHQPLLQQCWERKLFQHPERIPPALRRRFFSDYRHCAAFPVFFDLITPEWYRRVQRKTEHHPFYFLWGDRERVVASRYLRYWRRDFPRATFEVVPGWDHFPMLDHPEAFHQKIVGLTEEAIA